ncbi:citrate lyase subunit beta/citryl-CoA lyase [Arthrobacter pigmenti]|uniref:Citrate lyase subunit beta/citryl-CoA lyase n=1 Tax=Arthrobacter pigmenti TaxID=271432 RepID=A0A846RHH3_9MICC|nr:citrate lyase subunit beta/citryl-CoA lyase [Arthrobacter pigmenti]
MTLLTALYVPGNRPDRFGKAVGAGADMVILDLEDSVPRADKTSARAAVVRWLESRHPTDRDPVFQIRINPGDAADLEAVADLPPTVELRLPKATQPDDMDAIRGRAVTALLENALGVENAFAIARHPAVTRVALGESDLASELGSDSDAVLDFARLRLVFAARAAGIEAPMMSVYPRIQDAEGLLRDTVHGLTLGMVGRTAVHPTQLAIIREAHRPSTDELSWAESVQIAMATDGVRTLPDGSMVDPAMIGRAEQILVRHRAIPPEDS